jgi:cytoskeletal protein CcmA (bactofilin family)
MSGLNKIVTSISALTDDIIMPNNNDVVCIDTENSRIGVKTSSPAYDIDVSGTVKTNILRLGSDVSMTFLDSRIFTSNNITINAEISCNSFITSSIVSTDISSTSNLSVKIIRPITGNDISINGNIRFDGSLNSTTLVVRNINPLVGRDISINGNVVIDGSLNIKGMGYTAYGQITSSDDRLKHNEELIANALTTIRQLNPQIYQKTSTFKDPHYRGTLNDPYIIEAGLIAQEVEKIDELKFSVISGNEQSPYSLNYNNIFVYGLAALKELDTQVQIINENLNKNENFIKNEGSNDLATIVNNKIIYIGELVKKIEHLESRLAIIEKAF